MNDPKPDPKPAHRGRPIKLRLCVVCGPQKGPQPTKFFPPQAQAAVKDRCIVCGKAAMLERARLRAAALLPDQNLDGMGKAELNAASRAAAEKGRMRDRRLEQLHVSPKVAVFKQEFEERAAFRKACDATTEFFKTITNRRCECCYIEPATGQDSIGQKQWCSWCGWGIERTGRCLAHPGGEVYYPGLPAEGFTLPPELLATMRVPAGPLQEQPAREPDDDQP